MEYLYIVSHVINFTLLTISNIKPNAPFFFTYLNLVSLDPNIFCGDHANGIRYLLSMTDFVMSSIVSQIVNSDTYFKGGCTV